MKSFVDIAIWFKSILSLVVALINDTLIHWNKLLSSNTFKNIRKADPIWIFIIISDNMSMLKPAGFNGKQYLMVSKWKMNEF